ncbi:MAG: DNA-3-methyladenine glycosylase, partial [Bacteroidota bacterium]
MNNRLPSSFFLRGVLEVAPELPGRTLVRRYENGSVKRFIITEVEAYRDTEDLACHASKG